ncbi:MAG: DUF938 domain-containing protein [Pseudomonadales bacterium]|nr:DUF938 domain-containing protein [Pseudomonadales bacterium]
MTRPFSQACENNKQPILDVLCHTLPSQGRVLEIGSGTAQHILHFAKALPGLQWQPSELPTALPTLHAGLDGLAPPNVLPPLALDASETPWPPRELDAIISINTLHIMPYAAVEKFMQGVGAALKSGAPLCVYGAFKYHGEFTTPSNADFDQWLKQRDPTRGIRDFEQVNAWAAQNGLIFEADHALPANNQLIIWRKK